MSEKPGFSKIVISCFGRIPSVELGVIIPLSELEKQGLCVIRYRDDNELTIADIAWCDILFVTRGSSPRVLWAAKHAKKYGRIVLGYWDDNILEIPDTSLAYPYYSNPEVKQNINDTIKLTDAFFSPNSKLAVKLSAIHGQSVKVLPPPYGPEVLRPPKNRCNGPTVVGFAGSLDHGILLNSFLHSVIAATAVNRVDFKFQVVGPKPNFIGKLPVEVSHVEMIKKYADYLQFAANLNWDIGLAPQIDRDFTSYKYHSKFMEYAHIGCAGIYSNLEPYAGVIQDGITGLLVDNDVEAWKDAVLRLLKDSELRKRLAFNAYEYVQSHHNRKVVAEKYALAMEPYLIQRSPPISRINCVLVRVTDGFEKRITGRIKYLYSCSLYEIKNNGFKHFISIALKYLVSKFRRSSQ